MPNVGDPSHTSAKTSLNTLRRSLLGPGWTGSFCSSCGQHTHTHHTRTRTRTPHTHTHTHTHTQLIISALKQAFKWANWRTAHQRNTHYTHTHHTPHTHTHTHTHT